MASNYDPTCWMMRKILATELLVKLDDCGFVEDEAGGRTSRTPSWGYAKERTFSRAVNENVVVKVYTSIVEDEVRHVGKDAIRVCAIYTAKNGSTRGLVKNRSVHRTGNISEIADRMHQRMRDVWKATMSTAKCNKCGAPLFTSKKGNLVCAEACWARKNNYARGR